MRCSGENVAQWLTAPVPATSRRMAEKAEGVAGPSNDMPPICRPAPTFWVEGERVRQKRAQLGLVAEGYGPPAHGRRVSEGYRLNYADLSDASLDGQEQLDSACGTGAKLHKRLTLRQRMVGVAVAGEEAPAHQPRK